MKIVDANANIPRSYDNPSTAQVLERWSSGYRTDVRPPLKVVPAVHRMGPVDANAYIQRSYECPIRWNTHLPTVQRFLRTGERRHGETTSRQSPFLVVGGGGRVPILLGGNLTPTLNNDGDHGGHGDRKPELLESCSSLSFSPCSPWLGRRISGLSHLPELFLLRRVTCLGSLSVPGGRAGRPSYGHPSKDLF
jgi:hypothetical protein